MRNRPRFTLLLVLGALGALVAPLFSAPSASAADFIMRISPDRGAAGTPVTIYGVNDPGNERTVAWVCDWSPSGPPNQVIETVKVVNGSWQIKSVVPDECVSGYTEGPSGLVPHVTALAYGGDGAAANFNLTDAPAECPRVLFLGAHGVLEGAEGGGQGEKYWGSTIESVWDNFEAKVEGAAAEAGDYPRTDIDLVSLNTPLQISGLESAANEAAAALELRVIDQFVQCGTRTRIVLAGFSLGAWAVDKALRSLTRTPAGQAALVSVAAAGVMGDPAFPPHFCDITPCRMGVATRAGLGYDSDASYLDNGMSGRFLSMCLSYSESDRDWICGARNLALDVLDPHIRTRGLEVHNEYDDSGGTKQVADFLAGLVN